MVQAPTPFESNYFLGEQALAGGNASEACDYWLKCTGHLPKDLGAQRQLANAFRSIGQLTQAENLINTALNQAPGDLLLRADHANLLLDRGEALEAVRLWTQLAESASNLNDTPMALAFIGNALMGMEYTCTPTAQKETIARQWATLATRWAQHLVTAEQIPTWCAKSDATAPLRVGFLSGDLCDHPVGFLLLPLLQHRTPGLWLPYIYDNGSRVDQTHQQLQATIPTAQWRNISTLQDADAMRCILADQLDILIDLSGHTGRNRLRLMAHQLAGKQLSWLGFSGTTGLGTLDGIILDHTLAQDAKAQFCEPLLELNPSRFCFRPPFAPPLKPPPVQAKGYITFGSFNNTAKYNPELIRSWARILDEVPNSQLVLKWRTFADPEYCNTLWNDFARYDLDRSRIELRGFSTHRVMLDEYADIDIALDTFPFNGGYTSLEALWMGVPLVTLKGDTPISRQSASFLNILNNDNWIAHTTEQYVRIACQLANDLPQLITTRSQQRFQIMDSALYDAPSYAHQFERLLKTL
jgi:predicted O-linked N-acetylglucosamine transferase (SPINDLY family)